MAAILDGVVLIAVPDLITGEGDTTTEETMIADRIGAVKMIAGVENMIMAGDTMMTMTMIAGTTMTMKTMIAYMAGEEEDGKINFINKINTRR